MTDLVLAGHGSHLNIGSSEPFHRLAAALRASGHFDTVSVALWKEEPSLARALDATTDPDVVVVPVFISSGYFTRTVVPREMRLQGPLTIRGHQHIRYTLPVGTHPRLADVIIERAREAGAQASDALVILGHGTRRDSQSEKNIYAMAERVARRNLFAECGVAFIDQEPGMLTMLQRFRAERLFVVPLFIADGWHVGETIPADLALDGPETRRDGRIVRYTPPVGTHPALAAVVHELAREALSQTQPHSPSPPAPPSPAPSAEPPTPTVLAALRIEPTRVCGPGEPTVELPPDPEAVRRHVRVDDFGRYRPLTGANNLRSGWWVPLRDGLTANDVIEAVYPLATIHRSQQASGTLRIVPLDEVLERQTGRYEETPQLSPRGRRIVRDTLCGQCVRTPVWPLTTDRPASGSDAPRPTSCPPPNPAAQIPCPEPCSIFVALAREALTWERQPIPPSPVDPSVPFAAFEEPGNQIRETLLTMMHAPARAGVPQ